MKEYYSLKFKDIEMDNFQWLDSISCLNINNKGLINISCLTLFNSLMRCEKNNYCLIF